MRKRRTAEHREAICVARDWLCHLCGYPVNPIKDRWELDHVIPLANGGSDDDDNLAPAHAKCHLAKTAKDVEKIAKAKRQRAQHLKTKIPTRNPLPGSKRSRWKKHMDGSVTERCPTLSPPHTILSPGADLENNRQDRGMRCHRCKPRLS